MRNNNLFIQKKNIWVTQLPFGALPCISAFTRLRYNLVAQHRTTWKPSEPSNLHRWEFSSEITDLS